MPGTVRRFFCVLLVGVFCIGAVACSPSIEQPPVVEEPEQIKLITEYKGATVDLCNPLLR